MADVHRMYKDAYKYLHRREYASSATSPLSLKNLYTGWTLASSLAYGIHCTPIADFNLKKKLINKSLERTIAKIVFKDFS
jgi:hypothetical protein